jgi:hypothetical protein
MKGRAADMAEPISLRAEPGLSLNCIEIGRGTVVALPKPGLLEASGSWEKPLNLTDHTDLQKCPICCHHLTKRPILLPLSSSASHRPHVDPLRSI